MFSGMQIKLVDKEVQKSISKGVSSTLNCSEEVKLAEKLLEINPWFDMVKFTRTGAEANSVAIRIARAAAGKDNVAIVDIMVGMIGIYQQTDPQIKIWIIICYQV